MLDAELRMEGVGLKVEGQERRAEIGRIPRLIEIPAMAGDTEVGNPLQSGSVEIGGFQQRAVAAIHIDPLPGENQELGRAVADLKFFLGFHGVFHLRRIQSMCSRALRGSWMAVIC